MARNTSIHRAGVACALLAVLAGCTGYKAATKENFIRALNAYYSNHDDCLYPDALRFPYEASIKDKKTATKNMDALAHAGLLARQEEPAIGVVRYNPTPYGKGVGARFCYGHRVVTGIDDFAPPANVGGRQVVEVNYHYTMMDMPGWAKSSEMRQAFPALAKSAEQPEDKAELALTINGWVTDPSLN